MAMRIPEFYEMVAGARFRRIIEVGQDHDGARCAGLALPGAVERGQHLVGGGELAQVALAGPHHELDVGQERGRPVGLLDRHEGVGVPPRHQ